MVGWKSRVPVIIILCVLLMSVLSLLPAGEVFADGPQKAPLDIQARSYVLMEMETGQDRPEKGRNVPILRQV